MGLGPVELGLEVGQVAADRDKVLPRHEEVVDVVLGGSRRLRRWRGDDVSHLARELGEADDVPRAELECVGGARGDAVYGCRERVRWEASKVRADLGECGR